MNTRRPVVHSGPSETQLQISIVAALAYTLPRDAVLHHTHNEGKRSRADAGIAKAMGQRAGFADLAIFWRGAVFLIELKVGKNQQSPSQKKFQRDMAATGFPQYAVCRSLDEVIHWLTVWGVGPLRIVGNAGPLSTEGLDKAGKITP